ncbi:hypothetical protein JCM10450v2_002083 [Rhodotorula kratochvilovae]
MLAASVHLGCDRAPPPHRSLASLLLSLVCSLVTASLNLLTSLLPLPRAVRADLHVPDDLIRLVLEAWSPSSLDPLDAYAERNAFFSTCALVHRTWTPVARRLLHDDLFIAHPSHPVLESALRADCPIDLVRVKRITYVPKLVYLGSLWRLTSLALIDANTLELTDLGYAPNLRELHAHNVRIGPPASPPAAPFHLPQLLHLSLSEVCFTYFKPAFAALLCPTALPRLRTLSLHHCDLMWAVLPTPRLFPHVTHLRFTHPPPFPVTHLAPLRLPSLTHLTLCPTVLRAILARSSTSPGECAAALTLLHSARALSLTEDFTAPAPPTRAALPLPTFHPSRGTFTLAPSRGARTLALPALPVPALRGWRPTATLRWTLALDRTGVERAARATADALALLADAVRAGAVLPLTLGGGVRALTLPFAAASALPGAGSADAQACARARARLLRACKELGVRVRFRDLEEEEREGARDEWGGWGGCAEER